MAQHFISRIDAENDLLACAAYLAESIPPGETHASAVAAVVPAYLEKGNVDLAAELANTVDDPFTRDRMLIAVASKCAEIDDDEYALQLVEAIEDPGFRARGLEQIGFVKAGKQQIEKAGDIAAMMVHQDGVSARIAIAQAEAGDDEASLSTIDAITFPRDAATALIQIAAAKSAEEKFDEAIAKLNLAEAKASEIEHDEERIRTFCEIGTHFIDAGDKSRAFQVFEKARTEAEELASNHRDALLAQVAIGFLNAGSVDAADRTLDVVSDKTQIGGVLLAFARDHWQKDEHGEAFEALEEAHAVLRSQHETETRDSRAKFVMMGTVAAQFAGFERCERAIEIADLIPDQTHKNGALSQIAQIAATQGNYPIAEQAASEIDDKVESVVTTILMSGAARKSGDNEKSEELIGLAAKQIEELPEPTMRFSALLELSKVRFDNGDRASSSQSFEKALNVLLEVRNSNFKVSGLTEMGRLREEFEIELTDERLALIRQLLQS